MTEEVAVDVFNLAKSYNEIKALDDLSIRLSQGSRCVLLGPNGAGKSTFLNLVLGVLKPDLGSISVFGRAPGHITVRRRTGAMLQISGIPSTLTVREHLRLFRSYYRSPRSTNDLLSIAGLQGLEGRLFGTLSGGQQQRLNFALALCGSPDLLILDEPSTSHDVEARIALWNEVDEFVGEERTLLLATHDLEEAERLGDRIAIFHEGRIIADASCAKLRSMIGTTEISAQTDVKVDGFQCAHHIKRIERSNGEIRLYVSEAERTVSELLRLDPDLKNLIVKPATLQDAYLHLLSPNSTNKLPTNQ